MIDQSKMIESIYSNSYYRVKSKFIHDHNKISSEKTYKKVTRYFIDNIIKYEPYEINLDSFNKLWNNIIVVPKLWDIDDYMLETNIISMNDTKFSCYEYEDMGELLHEGQYTTNGLLAFRFMNYYNNEDFKIKVENDLLKFMFKYNYNNKLYYVTEEVNNILQKTNSEDLIIKILNNFAFSWKGC